MKVHPLDSEEKASWAFMLIKTDTPDGHSWSFRTTAKPNLEELLGALEIRWRYYVRSSMDQWD